MRPRNLFGKDRDLGPWQSDDDEAYEKEMLCGVCNEFIDIDNQDELFAAMGRAIHPECYKCSRCECQLDDVFYAVPDSYFAD
eukprot:10230188-Prorocentrum_lima.AAC.1